MSAHQSSTVTDIGLTSATEVVWLTSDGQIRCVSFDSLNETLPLPKLCYKFTVPGKDGKCLVTSSNTFSVCDSRRRTIRHHETRPHGTVLSTTTTTSPVIALTPGYLFDDHAGVSKNNKNTTVNGINNSPGINNNITPYGMYATYDTTDKKVCVYGYNNTLFAMSTSENCVPFSACLGFEYLVVGDYHGLITVYKWKFQQSRTYKTFLSPKHKQFRKHRRAVSSIAMTEHLLVTGSWDGSIALYEIGAGQKDEIEKHFKMEQPYLEYVYTKQVLKKPHRIHAVSARDKYVFDEAEKEGRPITMVAASGDDCIVRVWQYNPSDKMRDRNKRLSLLISFSHHSPVHALSFSSCASTLVSGCSDSSVRLMTIPSTPNSDMQYIATKSTRRKYEQEHEPRLSFNSGWMARQTDAVMRSVYAHPRQTPSSACPMCETEWWTTKTAKPMICGRCGDVIGCVQCMTRLGVKNKTHVLEGANDDRRDENDGVPCPLCKRNIFTEDIVPHYDFISRIDKGKKHSDWDVDTGTGYRLIDAGRLRFQCDDSMVLTRRHSCVLLQGTMDDQPVLIRYPRSTIESSTSNSSPSSFNKKDDNVPNAHWKMEAMEHVKHARRMHAPFINTHFGVCLHSSSSSSSSSTFSSDAIISVEENPSGGTLEQNIETLSSNSSTLTLNTFVGLALQLSHAVKSVHRHGVTCGHSLLPSCVGLSWELNERNGMLPSIKLLEFGGLLSMSLSHVNYCIPHDFVPYAAPELAEGSHIGAKADVYTLAMIFWHLATLEKPSSNAFLNSVDNKRPDIAALPYWMPTDIVKLLASMWQSNCDERPDMDTVIQTLSSIPSAPLPPVAIAIPAEPEPYPQSQPQLQSQTQQQPQQPQPQLRQPQPQHQQPQHQRQHEKGRERRQQQQRHHDETIPMSYSHANAQLQAMQQTWRDHNVNQPQESLAGSSQSAANTQQSHPLRQIRHQGMAGTDRVEVHVSEVRRQSQDETQRVEQDEEGEELTETDTTMRKLYPEPTAM